MYVQEPIYGPPACGWSRG